MKRSHIAALFAIWCLCFARAAYAVTFTTELRAFDYQSLFWATATGFLAGVFRLIYTLASENTVVYAVLKQARKDLTISVIAAGAMYLILLAISSKYPDMITREIRLVAILGAGWMGRLFVNALGVLAKNKFEAVNRKLQSDAPTSDVVPLESRR